MVKQGRRTSETAGRRVSVTTIVVVLIAVAALGVVAYYSTVGTPPSLRASECTPTGGHDHASFSVFVHNSSVSWDYPQFWYPAAGRLEGHVHQGAPHTLHMEGGDKTCTTVERFMFTALLTRLTEKVMVLDSTVHQGAAYDDDEGGDLRFFLGEPPAEWKNATRERYLTAAEVEWKEEPRLPKHQPRDGEYLLVTFGNETDADIRWQQLSIPTQIERE